MVYIMKKNITPTTIMLGITVLGILIAIIIQHVFDNSVVYIAAPWAVFILGGAFVLRFNDRDTWKYSLKNPFIMNLAIFIYTALTAMDITSRLYEIVMLNPELLSPVEVTFAKVALFACAWLVTIAAIFWIANRAADIAAKLNTLPSKEKQAKENDDE